MTRLWNKQCYSLFRIWMWRCWNAICREKLELAPIGIEWNLLEINKERISDTKRIIRNNLWSRLILYRSSKTALFHCSTRGKHCTNSSILRNPHSSVIGLVIDYRGNARNGGNVIVNCHINIVWRTGNFGLHMSEKAASTRGILLVFANPPKKTTQETSEERLLERALPPAHTPLPSNWHTHSVYEEEILSMVRSVSQLNPFHIFTTNDLLFTL
jgi:hypothetical protein